MQSEKTYHKAKKSLGQNFLKSLTAVYSLVNSAEIKSNDVVVEVGPGKGVITKILLGRAGHVIAVEKDDTLYKFLIDKFKNEIESGKLELIHGDILEFNPEEYKSKDGYILIGSIPYYITGIFIKTFLADKFQPKTIALIIQKEVAKRIVARDGKESILSISVKVYGNSSYVKTIKAREFSPKPKVDSAIFTIKDIAHSFFNEISEELFFKIVKQGYKSKRKKLVGNLSALFPKDMLVEVFQKANILPNVRAENLSVDDWGRLVRLLS